MTYPTMLPKLSFIIPTKDRLDLLTQTLESVLAQSNSRWEAIVVDDGSRDGTWPYLQAAAREDDRIRPMRRRGPAGGACVSRNQGAAAAASELLVFLDSDDLMEPFAVADRLAAAEQSPADLIITQGRCFERQPDDLSTLWNGPTDQTPADDLDRCLSRDVPWQTTGATWRREAFKQILWDENAPSGQDMDLHVRALLAGLTTHRTSTYDFHWRIGQSNRKSIGTASVTPRHIAYRCVLLERFATLMRRGGQWNERRRDILAGQWWLAVKMLRERGPLRPATRLWDRGRHLGLYGKSHWLLGTAWLMSFGRRQLREPIGRLIQRRWPAVLRGENVSTLTTFSVPRAWEIRCWERRREVCGGDATFSDATSSATKRPKSGSG